MACFSPTKTGQCDSYDRMQNTLVKLTVVFLFLQDNPQMPNDIITIITGIKVILDMYN